MFNYYAGRVPVMVGLGSEGVANGEGRSVDGYDVNIDRCVRRSYYYYYYDYGREEIIGMIYSSVGRSQQQECVGPIIQS